jgi:hypothetical protein
VVIIWAMISPSSSLYWRREVETLIASCLYSTATTKTVPASGLKVRRGYDGFEQKQAGKPRPTEHAVSGLKRKAASPNHPTQPHRLDRSPHTRASTPAPARPTPRTRTSFLQCACRCGRTRRGLPCRLAVSCIARTGSSITGTAGAASMCGPRVVGGRFASPLPIDRSLDPNTHQAGRAAASREEVGSPNPEEGGFHFHPLPSFRFPSKLFLGELGQAPRGGVYGADHHRFR